MNVRTRLIGAEQALRALDGLDKKVRNTINRKAVRAGGKVFLDSLRAHSPKRNGYLKRSLTQKPKSYRRNGTVVAIIGQNKRYTREARKKTRRTQSGGISGRGYAVPIHFAEYGTRPHKITAAGKALNAGGRLVKSVQHPGARGSDFVRKTEAASRRAVEAAVTAKVQQELASL